MSNLKSAISGLAENFASAVLSAIRSASLEEILDQTGSSGRRGAGSSASTVAHTPASRGSAGSSSGASSAPASSGSRASKRGTGRRIRRTANDIASAVDSIEALLLRNPSGLRAEQIRKELNLEAKELPRPLAEGVQQKRFAKEGQKRATTYFAKSGGAAGSAKKAGRRGGKRKG